MKLYIKASFDNWVPDWFKADKGALKALAGKGIDLKNLILSEHKGPSGTQYVVYHLKEDRPYGRDMVWIPGVYNDGEYITDPADGKYKSIKYIAKKRLPIVDTYYINIDEFKKAPKERYQDPRNDEYGKYAGQYYNEPYEYYDGTVREGYWSKGGRSAGRNGRQKRDKSGYIIPDPSDRLLTFYQSKEGTDKLTAKLQNVHDDLIKLKSELFDIDFDTFGKDYDGNYDYSSTSYQNMLGNFGDATRDYKLALRSLERAAKYPEEYNAYDISSAYRDLKGIEESIKKIRQAIVTERY